MQNRLFDNVLKEGTYGQYFFASLGENNIYTAVSVVNATAQDAVGAYSAFLMQQIIRDAAAEPNLIFEITDHPLPVSAKFLGIESSNAGFTAAFLFAVSFMMIGNQLIQSIIRERTGQLRHQIIVSGGSLKAYWISHYIGDFVF